MYAARSLLASKSCRGPARGLFLLLVAVNGDHVHGLVTLYLFLLLAQGPQFALVIADLDAGLGVQGLQVFPGALALLGVLFRGCFTGIDCCRWGLHFQPTVCA